MRMRLRWLSADAARALQRLQTQAPKAVARAINKSATSVRVVAAREVSADTGLRVGTVRDAIRIYRATPEHMSAALEVSGRRIPLIEFGAQGPEPSRGKGRGVSYRIGSVRRRIPNAFIATTGVGRHRGVFRRVATKRLPIVELFGPSLPKVFSKPALVRRMHERYEEQMSKNLVHEIEFELRRLRRH